MSYISVNPLLVRQFGNTNWGTIADNVFAHPVGSTSKMDANTNTVQK
jgi:hypothetical protein